MYVPHERRALILRLLEQRGSMRSAELARELGVTEETIRTDIIALHQRRLLHRVHGGARFTPPNGGEEDATRLDCQLAARLARHVQPGMVIYADAGPLMQALLACLSHCPCTFIAPSPRMLTALLPKALPQQAIAPPGLLDKESLLIDCDAPAAFLKKHRVQLALLTPPSIPQPGTIAYQHTVRAKWAAAATQVAQHTIVAAPAPVFYTQAPYSVSCTPHLLIAEDNLPSSFDSLNLELVPYLSPADLRQQSESSPF